MQISTNMEVAQSESNITPKRRGPGKRSLKFKEILEQIRFDVPHEAVKLYPTLTPIMKFKMLEFLAGYCYPKLYSQVAEDDSLPPPILDVSTEELLSQLDGMYLRFSRTIRNLVDIDYWNKLNKEQTIWLNAFLDSEYNARPPKTYSDSERKNCYRRKYIARNDIFSWPRDEFKEDSR